MSQTILRRSEPCEPILVVNTTPLIDVMLVLLIMFIITIPAQTHIVAIDLPRPAPGIAVEVTLDTLAIDAAGAARWNGILVGDAARAATLADAAGRAVQPEIHFVPATDARFERVDAVLAMAKRAGITRLGFVGNERYAASF